MVRGRGYLRGVDDIRGVPVKRTVGTAATIGDIATVQIGPEIRRGIAEKNGEGEVVGGIVVMRYGENARDVIRNVKARIAELEPGLPPGVRIVPEYDRSMLIDRAVGTLQTKIWQEMAVVLLIVIIFLLHVRSAFVAVVTVPVGILLALLVMGVLGINANIMSLGGIAIAIGVMVDASLVMVENAHKHLERLAPDGARPPTDAERFGAVLDAAREVGPSLFFSLLIVTVSFLPVFALGQVEGRLFRPLALTKTFAMAAASLLAITLVPALMVTLIRGRIRREEHNPVSRFFIWTYRPAIRFTLRHPWLIILVSFATVLLTLLPLQRMMFGRTWIPFAQIGSEFMPPLNEGDLLYMPTTLPGISPQKAKELLQQTNRIIKSFPEVESVFGKIGRAETATDPAPLDMIETVVVLRPQDEWRDGMTQARLIDEMNAAVRIPGLTNAWTMPIRARTDMLATGIRTPVGVKLAGTDLSVLADLAARVEASVRDIPGTRSVYAERVTGGSYVDVVVDRPAAARYGLTTGDVLDVVATSIGGRNVTTTVEGLERYPVNVRYPRALRESLPALRNVLVPTPAGGHIPLGQVADLVLVEGPPMIKSENARPNAWVFIDLVEGTDLGAYVALARQQVDGAVTLPAGYSLRWSGQYEYIERANKRLQVLVPLTLAIILLLLVMHFRNLAEATILMITLPFAVVGALWLLLLLGFKWSLAVGVGLIAVAGLAAETGVVMQVYLDEAVRRFSAEGRLVTHDDLNRALETGAVDRVRPKLMTVLTTIIGLLPVMIGTGTGSEIMQRIAAPMVGGLVSSTLLTLIVIPAMYVVYYRIRLARGTIGASAAAATPSGGAT
jgi:Cu(I)/Ag(I) efflux system membrane protein CusA/SilA